MSFIGTAQVMANQKKENAVANMEESLSPSSSAPSVEAREGECKSAEPLVEPLMDVSVVTRGVPLEFWCADEPVFEASVTTPPTFFPVTLKTFGLRVFDEDSGDLLSHIEEVNRCADEAGEMGATEFQKIRLLMMSLPKDMKYVESFVPVAKKNEYKDFSDEVVKILSDKIRTAMNKFLQARRDPGESILKFFNRIVQMYKDGNALVGTDWENDSGHVTGVYTKMYQALYDGEKNELDRRLDRKLENQTLTVCQLKNELIDINKLSRSEPKLRIRKFKFLDEDFD